MGYKRHRSDTNQNDIVDYLRSTGRSVVVLSQVGAGCPDLLVGNHGHNILMEVKTKTGKLSETQIEFMNGWRGRTPYVVRSVEDVKELFGDE